MFNKPLPPTSAALIESLDEHVKRMQIGKIEQLSSEDTRLRMAFEAGRRDLVDQLVRAQNKGGT